MQNCWRKAPDKTVSMDRRTDSHGDSSIPPTLRCVCVCVGGGYNKMLER